MPELPTPDSVEEPTLRKTDLRELEEVEGRLAEGTGEGSLPRTDPTEGRRPGLG